MVIIQKLSEQGFAIQWTQSRELSELRKSINFHLYIEQSIKHQLTQPSYPNTIAIAIRITGSGTNIYITVCPAFVYRVLFKCSNLEEYLYQYKVLFSFVLGVFLSKG